MFCRKNQSTLTSTEKARFVAAVLALKANGRYDQYVQDHMNFMRGAHSGPAFFPWHREFLRRFELDLQAIDSAVTLPYWDWTVDNSPTSSIWDPGFMGGNGRPTDGQVMTGAFAFSGGNWPLNFEGGLAFGYLRRRFGVSASAPTLPTATDVTNALVITPYDVSPYNDGSSTGGFRNRLEGWYSGPQLHNRVHVWVGGSMTPGSSPNDPVFFLHHCFVDKLWADWQRLHPAEGYLPISPIAGKPGHSLNENMEPWAGRGQNVTPASVLDHHALGYAYDTEGLCVPNTLKFIDDKPTLTFLDDLNTLKFRDDVLTLKFIDDKQTLKFRDDPITLKFSDDKQTLKFTDEPVTLKFSDDIGTSPRIDPIKQPALDKPPETDVKQPGLDREVGRINRLAPVQAQAVPFVLATPHHSNAWAQSFPEAARTTAAQYESAILQYEQALGELHQAAVKNQLSDTDIQAAEMLHQEYLALVAEYQQLTQGR